MRRQGRGWYAPGAQNCASSVTEEAYFPLELVLVGCRFLKLEGVVVLAIKLADSGHAQCTELVMGWPSHPGLGTKTRRI
jgi:hypothetical protein